MTAPNIGSVVGDYIHIKRPTTGVHYGVRTVEYCEISTLHRIMYHPDEDYRWGDVNLNHGGLEWHFAVDPYVSATKLFPTHPTALIERIICIGENDDGLNRFARIVYIQQYCPLINSASLRRRVPCLTKRSALRFVVFYVRTATKEVQDFSDSIITILR